MLQLKRNSQPQPTVTIDWSNPISKGLQYLHVPGSSKGVNLVSGEVKPMNSLTSYTYFDRFVGMTGDIGSQWTGPHNIRALRDGEPVLATATILWTNPSLNQIRAHLNHKHLTNDANNILFEDREWWSDISIFMTSMGGTGTGAFIPKSLLSPRRPVTISGLFIPGTPVLGFLNGRYIAQSSVNCSAWLTNNINIVNHGSGPSANLFMSVHYGFHIDRSFAEKVSADPWQLFAPIDRQVWTGLSTQVQQVTIARPASDIIVAGWSASTGSDLYAMLDETVASDTDYIISPTLAASNDPVILGLSSALDAGTWAVKMRVKATTGTGDVRASLLDGSNTVVGISEWLPVTGDFSEYTFSVNSSAQATRVRIEVRE